MNEASPCAVEAPCATPVRQPEKQEAAWGNRQMAPEGNGAQIPVESKPSLRVLVVEDDIFFRQLNTDVLLRSGYAVQAVEDGAAAWEALKMNHYDLLVTDNNMPRISGVELLRMLFAAHINLPVIMATGAIPTDELSRLPSVQPSAMLQKPYAIAELVRAVRRVLSEARAHAHSE